MGNDMRRTNVAIVALVFALLWVVPSQGARSRRSGVPRKTGNLSITSIRPPLMKGEKPPAADPLLTNPQAFRTMGATGVEDYITFDVAEPSKGQPYFEPYIANALACRKLKLKYAIYPWVHFYPDWVEQEKGFVPYTNLMDGSTCRQPSGWAPFTEELVDHFYGLIARYLKRHVTAVYVTDCTAYGELGYPVGYTKWLRKDDNAKPGWWCGDNYARQDFRDEQLAKYGSLEAINAAWGTTFTTAEQIDYPPRDSLNSNRNPRKIAPPLRRWILDFVYWYQDASARRVKKFINMAQSKFPNRPCEIKLGHGGEPANAGHSYSSACRILKDTPRLAIRSTHASLSYAHVKRVATPAHFYGFPFLTEPPGTVKPEKMAERIYTDACCGVSAYFDYPQNPPAAKEAFTKNIGLLDGIAAQVDVAIFFVEADLYLRIDQPYPDGFLECAQTIRDVADFDIVDERLIADGALADYAILLVIGQPLIEVATYNRLKTAVQRDRPLRIIQIQKKSSAEPGRFECVDGQIRTIEKGFTSVQGKPTSNKVINEIAGAYRRILQ